MPRISIVTSLYRVASHIDEFYTRSRAALEKIPGDHEFVFVDDGSPDDAREIVLRLIARDPRVRLVELSRNFGQHRALWIGLQQARGDLVFMVDADLEEDPALVATFYTRMQEQPDDVDVVYGVMEERTGDAVRRLGGALFYTLMDRLSDTRLPRNVLNARLMTRAYVDSLLQFGDAEPFLGALMTLNGFRQIAIPCAKGAKGSSTYTFRRKLRLALDALFALSTTPLTWIFWGGAWIAAIGLAGVAGVLRGGGGASAMALASVWFIGGLVLVAVGTVGAYVSRVLTQARGRPVAIIRRIHEAPPMIPAPKAPLNVLVLACGGSVGHGILKALALSTLRLRVLGADIAPEKVGLYTVDRAFVSPWAHDPAFMNWLLPVCRAERVDAIIGGAEPTIKFLAEHQDLIQRETGAVCVVTTAESFLIGDDKLTTCRWLERHGFAAPAYASSEDPEAVCALAKSAGYPLIAKPRVGGGGRGQVRVENPVDLEYVLTRSGYIFQQYVGDDHSEYTVGCFCDRHHELRGTIVLRRRLEGGQTVFAEAGEFPVVREAAERITRALKPIGPCNLQFRMQNGRPYCFELQVRFSGTTPVRTRFGFNEVEAALRHFVLGEDANELPRVVEGCMARYWTELYIDPLAYAKLKATGRLDDPAAHRPRAEDYGVRPCES